MVDHINLKENLKKFDEEIKLKYSGKVIFDGIVDWDNDSYENSETKILWILKEANMKAPDDLSEFLFKFITPKHTSFKSTWGFVLEITNAILTKAHDWENDVTIGHILLTRDKLLEKNAVINIKKIGGTGRSNNSDILKYYNNDKDIIFKQIEYLSPDIIINASGVNNLFDTLKKRKASQCRSI